MQGNRQKTNDGKNVFFFSSLRKPCTRFDVLALFVLFCILKDHSALFKKKITL